MLRAYALAWLVTAATIASAQDVAPQRSAAPAIAAAPVEAASSDVAPFYAAHPATMIWLGSSDGRAAADRLAGLLRNAEIDGLAEGPALAARVETALAGGSAADDAAISSAFVLYVQALARPVEGVSFGDPALRLRTRSASAILGDASSAPSLAAHVAAATTLNPLHSTLRSAALAQGLGGDPRVRATLDRLRLIPARGRAILVDAASAKLMLLEDGRPVETMKVVVGKPDFATPLLAGTVHYITFNPYWHIPQDVTKRKVAPIVLKRGIAYLKLARYETVAAFGGDSEQPVDPAGIDWKAVAEGKVEANIRQLTGPNNMMGRMKFGFVNDYGIFLHDTPHKELFKKEKRTLSLGCVRVENPDRLASWLLGREPDAPGSDAEQNVLIDGIGHEGVPIFITYLTAQPDGDKLSFAPDVYGLDRPKAAPVTASSSPSL